MARFKIGDTLYSTAALDEVTLADIIRFNTQVENMGLSERWHDVEQAAAEMASGTPAAAMKHPMRNLVIGVTIWAARRVAGEDVTFEEAVDFPVRLLEMLPEPGDRKPGKRSGAKKAPAKNATRKVSAAAAKPAAE